MSPTIADQTKKNKAWASLKLPIVDVHEVERKAREDYVRKNAEPRFRTILDNLYATWHGSNALFFEGKLQVPHLGIGLVPPRSFSHCSTTTTYGGAMEITISDRVAFGTDQRLIRNPWPALGTMWFLHDLLLRETVHQSVFEAPDPDNHSHDVQVVERANRIGQAIGVRSVSNRRRLDRDHETHVIAQWPWILRPVDYYLGHVSFDHLKIGGMPIRPPGRQVLLPGIAEYLLWLAQTSQYHRLIQVLGQMRDAELIAQCPAIAAFEKSPRDSSGMALPMPIIDPAWLTWGDGCVMKIAEGIRGRLAFEGMPILADALQDAGCEDQVLLDHCRAQCRHTAQCWAIKMICGHARS